MEKSWQHLRLSKKCGSVQLIASSPHHTILLEYANECDEGHNCGHDRVKRVQNREGGAVNVCQVSQEESIEKLVRRIVQDNLSEMELNASEKITSATLDPNTARVANETQKEERLRRKMRALINYPDHFALESVKERWLRCI
ncbi:unnamed protein product [Rhizophagus irregularis]|nr:unnamed protein product [Rhizophagus irregularis]